MDIISCLNTQGKPIDKGTLVNGDGTVNIYDNNGSLIKVESYINGVKKE
jgi:antitoxin component YwqK of YwqJK toxin-antitoxin module